LEEKVMLGLMPGVSVAPPLALYIHLPWCVRKCPYCDFNSHAAELVPEAAYIDALSRDLELALPEIWGRRVHTVFFGGGTPSLFSPEGIDRILTVIRTLTQLEPLAEITLEANPGTVEAGRFRGYREAGVTRVSLGVQSFDDDSLERIGRIHGGMDARHAAQLAAQTFATFNLDLMYALPGQTQAQLEADI
jgi:putative oxygen-independent coproporphyrinogen III oxidase